MAEYAVMPKADYQDACDAVREKTGETETIKSGDMGAKIRSIDTQENLDDELTQQDNLIGQIMTALEGKAAVGGSDAGEWTAVAAGDIFKFEPDGAIGCVFVNTDGWTSDVIYAEDWTGDAGGWGEFSNLGNASGWDPYIVEYAALGISFTAAGYVLPLYNIPFS